MIQLQPQTNKYTSLILRFIFGFAGSVLAEIVAAVSKCSMVRISFIVDSIIASVGEPCEISGISNEGRNGSCVKFVIKGAPIQNCEPDVLVLTIGAAHGRILLVEDSLSTAIEFMACNGVDMQLNECR